MTEQPILDTNVSLDAGMKPSPYNHFFDVENKDIILLFNSYTGAMAEIERNNHPRVMQLLSSPEAAATSQDNEFLQCLKDGGFLIPEAVDQFAALKTKVRTTKLEGSVLTLTIAPTLACNFDCDYCFESHSPIRMTPAIQNSLLEFSERYFRKVSGLRLCWFGGEPTIALPILEQIQSELLKRARKYHVTVLPGIIITNGYLLNAAMAMDLKNLGIVQAQITIDGPQEVHDRRRKLRNGKGTYHRIIENLAETADIMDIIIRINVDKENMESACRAVIDLAQKNILPRVKISFAQVTSAGAACSNIRDRCYEDEEFAEILVQLYSHLHHYGINKIESPHVHSGAACGAVCRGHFVVSPTGYLFKCWEELSLDSARSVGHLLEIKPTEAQQGNLENYLNWDPFELKACRDCNILPLCMGGCPLRSLQNSESKSGLCSSWKFNLGEMLTIPYRDISENVQNHD